MRPRAGFRRNENLFLSTQVGAKMTIKPIAKILYGFFGALFVIVGVAVLLLRTVLLPDALRNIIMDVGHGDSNTLHIIQEFGSLLVFAGLISFWFVRHYERSKAFHWAMTAFWVLFALAHWFPAGGESLRSVRGPMIDTVPFILFLAVGMLRAYSEDKAAT